MRVAAFRIDRLLLEKYIEETDQEYSRCDNADEFLGKIYDAKDTMNVVWNLDFEVSKIAKLLQPHEVISLAKIGKCKHGKFDIFYAPHKVLSIRERAVFNGPKATLYGIDQFYPDMDEPSELRELCGLAQKVIATFNKMYLRVDKLTSPIGVYESCIMRGLHVPTYQVMPLQAAQLAYEASGKVWVEAHKLGFLDKVWDADIRSCYPNIMANLVDLRQCRWEQSKEYQFNAVYGYLKGKVHIYDNVKVSPIIYEHHGRDGLRLQNRQGTWETVITKGEYDFIHKQRIGRFEIDDAWWCFRNTKEPLRYPYRKIVQRLIEQKTSEDKDVSTMAKRVVVGISGKMGEERKKGFGPYFNPCYRAEINSQCNIKVAEFLYRHGIGPYDNSELVHISTDGCLVTKEIDLTNEPDWKLAYSGEALIVSSGMVFFKNKHPQGLSLSDVLELIKKHPRKGYYSKTMKRPITLVEAVHRNRLDLLGEVIDTQSAIDLYRMDHDREFKKLPKSGEALLNNVYESEPLMVGE